MTQTVVRFRLVGQMREAEVGRYLLRIDVGLGPEELPLPEREMGFRVRAYATHSGVLLWEDWSAELRGAKSCGAAWLAGKLGTATWSIQ